MNQIKQIKIFSNKIIAILAKKTRMRQANLHNHWVQLL